jgi:hypothetical protein
MDVDFLAPNKGKQCGVEGWGYGKLKRRLNRRRFFILCKFPLVIPGISANIQFAWTPRVRTFIEAEKKQST